MLQSLLLLIFTVPLLYSGSPHTNILGGADGLPVSCLSELCVKGFGLGDDKRTSQPAPSPAASSSGA